MKIRLLRIAILLAAAILLSGIATGNAAEFPYPKVEFSADMSMRVETDSSQTHTIRGKVYSAKGRERREVIGYGRKTAIIKNRNSGEYFTLMPDQKMYIKNKVIMAGKDPETMIRNGELKLTRQGSEEINGYNTTKYKLESAQKGGDSFTGYAWFTKQNIPILFKGTSTNNNIRQKVEVNYSNIVIAKQPPALFSIPKDYRSIPSRLEGINSGPQRASPEQMRQFQEMMKRQRRP